MTSLSCENIEAAMSKFQLARSCSVTRNGALRLATPLYYPDTSQIDVFVESRKDLFPLTVVSDFGQTADMLLTIKMSPWGTKKRRQLVQEICSSLKVEMDDGRIQTTLPDDELTTLPDAIFRVAQACLRVSDLYMTKRLYTPSVYRDDVEEFFGDKELSFESGFVLPGTFGRDVAFDFMVKGHSRESLVQTLSTGNSQVSHHISIDAFAKWHDLNQAARSRYGCVTVYDSSVDVFREDDIERCREYSQVFAFPADAEPLAKLLSA